MSRKASLIRSDKLVLPNGSIVQIRVWRLPEATPERPHGLKYSLFFGRAGKRVVGYDNEAGKGDHRHRRLREERYVFVTLEKMIDGFYADVSEELKNEGT